MRRITAASVVVLTLTAGTALASPASAGSAGSERPAERASTRPSVAGVDNPGPAFWARQKVVGDVADAIVAASRTLPKQGGYGGLVTAPEKSRVTVYWKGRVPAAVRRAADSDRRVKVSVERAPYTQRQLRTARDRVFAQRAHLPEKLTSVGPGADGKGLLIGVAPADRETALSGRETASLTRSVADITGGIAITRVRTENPQAATGKSPKGAVRAAGRAGEQAFGGARWVYPGPGGTYNCSTGFAVRYPNGARLMASAAHCGEQYVKAHSPEFPDSRPFGWIGERDTERDINLLYPEQWSNPGFFQSRMWWGPWAYGGGNQQTWPVKGLHQNHVGQKVCSSGAASGNICDITIDATEQTVVTNSGTIYRTIKVSKPAGQPIWGPGDSGGPISQPNGSDVYANGIVSSSNKAAFPAGCQGDTDRNCASVGWYAPLDIYLEKHGLELVTE